MLRIIYNGIPRCDFVYYLSLILSKKSSRVIVNDVSATKDLFNAISKNSPDNVFEMKNIIFVKDLIESESSFLDEDIYIEYRGMSIIERSVQFNDTMHLIMPDYSFAGVTLADRLIPEGEPIYILRDYCSKAITDKDFALASNLKREDIIGHISLSAKDVSLYQALTFNGKQKFINASEEMLTALEYVTTLLLGIKEKEAKKLFKEANK